MDNLEQGVTPCDVTAWWGNFHTITVAPPTIQQLRAYEEAQNLVVSTWYDGHQSKALYGDARGGTMFFEFITREYKRPTTANAYEQLSRDLKSDSEALDRKRQQILKVELPSTD